MKKILAVAAIALALTACNVTNAPVNVANKTFETNNIIHSYEWFYNVNANYTARTAQVAEYAGYLKTETDPKEKARLRMESSAMRVSCRDLVTKYNAESQKVNKRLFKSGNLPETLSIEPCEVN